ncbi:response regulator [Salinibius halmophilus]|uniref:response regulator n=1 Tax=Salinibius halmophilus TaxID=1853216 RepID=UPI000E666995|nr:response regulator [Salinibius halmophilus]
MKKILLVDDSKTMLMSLESVLKKAQFETKAVTSGQEALTTVQQFAPDLVITDLNMPGMDGIELIKQLKAQPKMRFKPILMLTTESQASKRAEAKAAGATGWLVKPVAPNDLLAVLKKVLPGV